MNEDIPSWLDTSSSIKADRLRKKRANAYILTQKINADICFRHEYPPMHMFEKSQLKVYLAVLRDEMS